MKLFDNYIYEYLFIERNIHIYAHVHLTKAFHILLIKILNASYTQ